VDAELGESFAWFNRVLAYFGYEGLSGLDLERLSPGILMDPPRLIGAVPNQAFRAAVKLLPLESGEILSSRFFAPKITDVSLTSDPPLLGWRKVVRLKSRTTSRARAAGLDAAWVLFNVFSNSDDPFAARSSNNQVMLVRTAAASKPPRPIYWLMYNSVASGDGERTDHLDASFDARDPKLASGKYYVPTACAQCHGGLDHPEFLAARLNYLDTDHWFDRTKDDFTHLPAGIGVIVDGGTDVEDVRFKRAFNVIYQLNQEIRAQNHSVSAADPGSFQLRAVDTWLAVHKNNNRFIDMFDRNVAPQGGQQWSKENQVDRQLLPLLSRYCFRCHSSVEYHVFDKDAVLDRTGRMVSRLKLPFNTSRAMPADRNMRLSPAASRDLDCLLRLLPLVGQNVATACGG
jgi:hypothetical protein